MGLNKGLSDLIICLESHMTKDKKPHLIFIEMKRTKGGYESKDQKWWRSFINSVNGDLEAVVKKGCEEAKIYIESLLKPKLPPPSGQKLENLINNL